MTSPLDSLAPDERDRVHAAPAPAHAHLMKAVLHRQSFSDPQWLFERKLDVVRRLLAGETVTAAGDGYELTEARLTLVPDRVPPIWLAADSDRGVKRAAVLGDAWFVNPHARLDELERQMRMYRTERAGAGLPPAAVTPARHRK